MNEVLLHKAGLTVNCILKPPKERREEPVRQAEKKKAKTKKKKSSKKKKTASKTYTVKKGDCLWKIAKKKLGKGSREKEIYKLNKSLIEKTAKKHGKKSSNNGWWIYPGTKLKLPKK